AYYVVGQPPTSKPVHAEDAWRASLTDELAIWSECFAAGSLDWRHDGFRHCRLSMLRCGNERVHHHLSSSRYDRPLKEPRQVGCRRQTNALLKCQGDGERVIFFERTT